MLKKLCIIVLLATTAHISYSQKNIDWNQILIDLARCDSLEAVVINQQSHIYELKTYIESQSIIEANQNYIIANQTNKIMECETLNKSLINDNKNLTVKVDNQKKWLKKVGVGLTVSIVLNGILIKSL